MAARGGAASTISGAEQMKRKHFILPIFVLFFSFSPILRSMVKNKVYAATYMHLYKVFTLFQRYRLSVYIRGKRENDQTRKEKETL